jgi:RHS repeat-associated protein
MGHRTQRVDQLGTHTYEYDALYRLSEVTYPDPATDTYTYDAVGNRLTKNGDDYTYDTADRLTAVEGLNYGYDDNGNLTSRGSDTFSWNAAGRITSATVSSTTTTFAYNGDGLRDSRTQGSTTTFTWDVNAGIPQVLDDGTFKYVHGLGRISEVGPGTTHYYLPDGLGSTMGLVDASGASVNTYSDDVFGGIRSQTGSQSNEYQFAGEQIDGSAGLIYLRDRYYDPTIGRFMSRDRAFANALEASTLNRYVYAFNNPTNLVDPKGLLGQSIAMRTQRVCGRLPFDCNNVPGGRRSIGDLIVVVVGTAATQVDTVVDILTQVLAEEDVPTDPASNPGPPPRSPNADAVIDALRAGQQSPFESQFPSKPFVNQEGLLPPNQDEEFYTEYGVPGDSPERAERIVMGKDGKIYYTPDHHQHYFPVP